MSDIFIAGHQVDPRKNERVAAACQEAAEAVETRYPGFSGTIWFNTRSEATAFLRGPVAGIGVWKDRWVNLAGEGTIVWGFEHDDAGKTRRDAFVAALNLTHRQLTEAAWERSLGDLAGGLIPPHSTAGWAHQAYDAARGRALENYWIASAQYMAWPGAGHIASLREFAVMLPDGRLPEGSIAYALEPLKRPGELREILVTLANTTIPASPESGRMRMIVEHLRTAKTHARQCDELGLRDLATASRLELDAKATNAKAGAPHASLGLVEAWGDRMRYAADKVSQLVIEYERLAWCLEAIGGLQFHHIATQKDRREDVMFAANRRRQRDGLSTDMYEAWSWRREAAMLRNLRAAILWNPPPILVTLGMNHAESRRGELRDILGDRRRLVIGTNPAGVAGLGHRTFDPPDLTETGA